MDSLFQVIEKGLSLKDKILSNVYEYESRSHFYNTTSNREYASLKHECLSSGHLFSDPEFSTNGTHLLAKGNMGHIEWKRPHEISRNPRFFVDGASRFDLSQGEIGNCWLIATMANLTLNKDLFNQVVPPGQEFGRGYAGMFYFRFWCFGQWKEVVIDDKLPTSRGKLIYVTSQDSNEFWPSLLEKAYAKLQGSYRALDGGQSSDAMVHFTGGVTETIFLSKGYRNLFDIMNKGMERGSLLAASIEGSKNTREQKLSNGLVRGHAYSITNVCWCNISNRPGRPAQLVRLRNPWGNHVEWNGPWCDKSKEWTYVSAEEKRVLGIQFKKDGEFWMSYEDFKRNFDVLEMTNVNLQSLKEHDTRGRLKHMWKVQSFTGSWARGVSAGGCQNNRETFHINPKFMINLTDADDGDKDNLCTIIIALLQRPKDSKNMGSSACHNIGFSLFRVSSRIDVKNLDRKFFKRADEIDGMNECIGCTQISHRFNLPVGQYCVVPNTWSPGQEADFLLRIFTERAPGFMENLQRMGHPLTFNATSSNQSTLYNAGTPAGGIYPANPAVNSSIRAPYPVPSIGSNAPCAPYPISQITNNTPMASMYPSAPIGNTAPYPTYPHPPAACNQAYSPYPPTMDRTSSAPYPVQSLENSTASTGNMPPPSQCYPSTAINSSLSSPYPLPPPVNSSLTSPYPVSSTVNNAGSLPYHPPQTVNGPTSSPYPLSPTINNSSFTPYPALPTSHTTSYPPYNPAHGIPAPMAASSQEGNAPYPQNQGAGWNI